MARAGRFYGLSCLFRDEEPRALDFSLTWAALFCDTEGVRPDIVECVKLTMDDGVDFRRELPRCPILYCKTIDIEPAKHFSSDAMERACSFAVMNYKITIGDESVMFMIGAFEQRKIRRFTNVVDVQRDLRLKFAEHGFNVYDDNQTPELVEWDDRGEFRSP